MRTAEGIISKMRSAADSVKAATLAIHTAFGLDGDEDAVVYAGTGR